LQMANKEDNLQFHEDDECRDDDESTAQSTEQQTAAASASQDIVEDIKQKPLALEMSATLENDGEAHTKLFTRQSPAALRKDDDTRQKSLAPETSAALGNDDDTRQKTLASGFITTIEHVKNTKPGTSNLVTYRKPEKDKNTYLKPSTLFSSSDETNPKTHLAVSHSIILNASGDSDDESLKKPKYDTHVMLPDRQNLERHAGTLIDIYNEIHSNY